MKKLRLLVVFAATMMLLGFQGASAQKTGENSVKIKITSGEIVIMAVLNDSPPAVDLIKRLPITLNLHRHQSREYYADIGLKKSGATQDGYQVGDIAYWVSGNNLVLFFDKGYTGNLIIMGKMISDPKMLALMENNIRAQIEIIKNE